MSHIFISYSRKDLAIAEKIINALAIDDLEPWIDWKSIPKGEQFEREIQQGIEAAEIFLFLVSPDSVQSNWCNKEINHAVKNGKRILPIVLRDTDPKIIHPEISKRNWIFCREGQDDFSKAIEETHKTIHTDYEWLKYHTKLQIKALDWEKAKDHSQLLRGKELQEAEQKLAAISSNKDPKPTDMQRKYISASRIAENDEQRMRAEEKQKTKQRLRVLGIGLGGVVILATIATIVAILFGGQVGVSSFREKQAKETAQAEATARADAQAMEQEQRQIALARSLAEVSRKLGLADSQIFVGLNYPSGSTQSLAMLLAIESIKRNPTYEGIEVLSSQLHYLPRLIAQENYSTNGIAIPITDPEEERFAKIYVNPDNTKMFKLSKLSETEYAINVWETSSWKKAIVTNITVSQDTGLSFNAPITLSENTERFAYIGSDGVVLQRTLDSFSKLIWRSGGPYSSLKFSPDSAYLVASKEDGTIKVWNVDTQQEIFAFTVSPGTEFVSFIGGGSKLVAQTTLIGDNRYDVYVFDIPSQKVLEHFVNSLYLGANVNGNYIAVSFGNRYDPDNIHVWDISLSMETLIVNNECLLDFINDSDAILTMSKGKNGSCLSGLGDPIHIWDIKSKKQVYELELNDLVWAGTVMPEEDLTAISTGELVYVLDTQEREIIAQIPMNFIADTFAFSSDRSKLIIANKSPLPIVGGNHSYNAIVWDVKNNVEIGRIPCDSYIASMAFFGKTTNLIIAESKGDLTVWDINDLWKNKVFEYQHDYPAGMPGSVASGWTFAVPIFSPDEKQLAIGGGNGNLETFDFLSNQLIFSYSRTDMTLSHELAYSSNGKWVAFTGLFCQLGDCPNNVKILDTITNTVFIIDSMEPTFLANIAFSPDNRYLAIRWRGTQNFIRIWKTDEWKRIQEIALGDLAGGDSVAFTPTGDFFVLADANDGGNLLVFDVRNWKKVFEVNTPTDLFAFFSENKLLAVSSYDTKSSSGAIRVVRIGTWEEITSIQHNSRLLAITFNSSGEYIGAIDSLHNLIAWDTHTGRLISTKFMPAIGGQLSALQYHPSWFAVNTDNNILIIDVVTGTEIERIDNGEPVSVISTSPDGHFIASGGADGKVQIWYWRPDDLINEACTRLPRNLTRNEWKQYFGDEPYRATCPNLPTPTE